MPGVSAGLAWPAVFNGCVAPFIAEACMMRPSRGAAFADAGTTPPELIDSASLSSNRAGDGGDEIAVLRDAGRDLSAAAGGPGTSSGVAGLTAGTGVGCVGIGCGGSGIVADGCGGTTSVPDGTG